MISMISIMLPRAAVSANRINEVLDTTPSIKDKEKLKRFKDYDDYFYNGFRRSYVFRYGSLHGHVLETRSKLNSRND